MDSVLWLNGREAEFKESVCELPGRTDPQTFIGRLKHINTPSLPKCMVRRGIESELKRIRDEGGELFNWICKQDDGECGEII